MTVGVWYIGVVVHSRAIMLRGVAPGCLKTMNFLRMKVLSYRAFKSATNCCRVAVCLKVMNSLRRRARKGCYACAPKMDSCAGR